MQCTIATASPDGVVTISICLWSFASGFSRTTIANTDVPAETLPVLGATLFVATIPVPASPSGGQNGIPALRFPDISRSFAPLSVSVPALIPAVSTSGSNDKTGLSKPWERAILSNFSDISELYVSVAESTGNIPDASPIPSTRLPVSR